MHWRTRWWSPVPFSGECGLRADLQNTRHLAPQDPARDLGRLYDLRRSGFLISLDEDAFRRFTERLRVLEETGLSRSAESD